MRHHLWNKGQAIVEFALAATLIFFLLAAAVDLGLMFFAVQGLHNSAQEGGTYGSRWLITNGAGARVLDVPNIVDRMRHESGTRGGIGFVNLLDLNNNGVPDVTPDTPAKLATCLNSTGAVSGCDGGSTPVVKNYIQIWMLQDADLNGDPLNDGTAPNYTACTNPSGAVPCFIRVQIAFDYRLSFPLSPTFARSRTLHSSFVMQLRDSFAQGSPTQSTPTFATVTPTPNVLDISIISFYKPSGSNKPVSIKIRVRLNGVPFDGATVSGTVSGTNIPFVASGGGTGIWTACNFGSFSGNNISANVTAASAGASDTASAGASQTLSPCP